MRQFALLLFGIDKKFLNGGRVKVSTKEAVEEAGEIGFIFVEVEGGSRGGDLHWGERERAGREREL